MAYNIIFADVQWWDPSEARECSSGNSIPFGAIDLEMRVWLKRG